MTDRQLFPPVFAKIASHTTRQLAPRRWSVIVVTLLALLTLIALGALLLSLPVAQHARIHIGWLDCFFTATSAITLTGLVTVSTADTWTSFGLVVILCLIQLGAFVYITAATVIALRLGLRLGLRERLQLPETPGFFTRREIFRVARYTIIMTLCIEAIGALVLMLHLQHHQQVAWHQAAFTGLFYAISAFCNAGFDLASGFHGLAQTAVSSDGWLLGAIGLLALLGSLGILVLAEIGNRFRNKRFSLHAKMVLATTGALLLLGAGCFLLFEGNNPLAYPAGHGWLSRLFTAGFMSITTRSAGFSPIPLTELSPPTMVVFCLLMLIGGAPGSAASGVKVTTITVMLLAITTLLRRRADIEVFHRRIGGEMVRLALSLVVIYLVTILLVIMGISVIEVTLRGLPMSPATMTRSVYLIFEVFSAFGNVGLRTGITPTLAPASRGLLIAAMLIGRLGPLAFVYIFSQAKRPQLRRLPVEPVMAG